MGTDLLIEEMYRLYAQKVKKYLQSLCGSSTLADDLTAETFYKAIKNIEKFKGGNMLTWLCTIGKNTYFDYLKKRESANLPLTEELAVGIAADAPTPEMVAVDNDERLNLYRHLRRLDADAREVVYLRMFTDLSFRDIGSILGKSESWARVTFYRSKIKLKEWYENEI